MIMQIYRLVLHGTVSSGLFFRRVGWTELYQIRGGHSRRRCPIMF